MAHRITFTSRHGAHQTVRLHGAQDRDMAIMALEALPWGKGAKVQSVDFVEDGAPFIFSEQNVEV